MHHALLHTCDGIHDTVSQCSSLYTYNTPIIRAVVYIPPM